MQQYPIRVRKNPPNLKYELMKFNAPLKNEFMPNLPAKIYREKEYLLLKKGNSKMAEDGSEPSFGAGSSYAQYVRNEKKQLTTPISAKDCDTGPWIMNLGTGKSLRSYKGNREGNVSENASYYAFMQTPDGAFEAYPLSAWYTFTPIPKHKTLNYDEAEEEFNRRDKVLNYFSIMVQKRLKHDDPGEGTGTEEAGADGPPRSGGNRRGRNAELTIHDDEGGDGLEGGNDVEDDLEQGSDGEDGRGGKKKTVQKPKKNKGKGKKSKDLEEEAEEESDDGDEEGQELDYMTSGASSDSGDDRRPKGGRGSSKSGGQANGHSTSAGQGVHEQDVSLEDLMDEDELLGVQDEPALREDEDEDDDDQGGFLEVDHQNGSAANGNDKVTQGITPMEEGSDNVATLHAGDMTGKKGKSKHRHHRGDNTEPSTTRTDEYDDWGNAVSHSKKDPSAPPPIGSSSGSGSSTSGSDSSSTDGSSDDSDGEIDDNEIQSSIFLQNKVALNPSNNFQPSQSKFDPSLQGGNKRKLGEPNESSITKKLYVEPNKAESSAASSNFPVLGQAGTMVLNEENVRRYLIRRPLTTKDLLHKFKNKVDTKMQLAERMTAILKKINPEKKLIKGKMYLSL